MNGVVPGSQALSPEKMRRLSVRRNRADMSSQDTFSQDRLPQDAFSQDRLPQDTFSQDRLPQDAFSQDRLSLDSLKLADAALMDDLSMADFFVSRCHRFADHPALTNLGRTLSYRQLERLSRNFAAFLQNDTALEPGDRIAIQLPNLLQFPIAVFGALRAGLVVVNTNPLYTAQEMRHQFNDSGAKALVVLANIAHRVEDIVDETAIKTVIVTQAGDAHAAPRRLLINSLLRHVKKRVPVYRLPMAISWTQAINRGASRPFAAVQRTPDDLAMLQYSGGTTGVAKGAMLSHRNLMANMHQARRVLSAISTPGSEIAIAPLPLYHIYSFTLNCLLMLDAGNHVVLVTNPRDLSAFMRELRRWRFTMISGLNPLFYALCKQSRFRDLDFSGLRITLSGGMALSAAVARSWREITGCSVIEGYGMTETAPFIAVNPPLAIQAGTVGLPMQGTEIKLLDDDGHEVPCGAMGELCVRGPQVMAGYWQQPKTTARVLDSDGWFRTGDIAQIQDDGYLRIIDRKNDMITVSGFNVYPTELEQTIASHPGIDECAVVGLPDKRSGELIKLYVVANCTTLTVQSVREYCRERLVAYKVPTQVEFRSELPRSNVGKVVRRILRDEALSRRQGQGRRMGHH